MIMAHTNTKTKCFKDPRYAIFFKSRGFKDIKIFPSKNFTQGYVDQIKQNQTLISGIKSI